MGELAVIPDNDDETAPADDDADLTRILAAFDAVACAEQEERSAALEDRRFVTIAGAQWDGDWGDQFENSLKVEIDKTAQGVERIIDQYKSNRVIVNFREVDKGASAETAETLNGMFRADFYRSHGPEVFDNAFEEGASGGYGGFRLTNEYVDDYDPEDERQHISFEAITDADQSLFFGPSKLYNKADAPWGLLITAHTEAAFRDRWPDAQFTSWPEGFPKPVYDWFTPDVTRVAEYYEVEEKSANCRYFEHLATGETRKEFDLTGAESAAIVREGWKILRVRKVKRRRIAKWVLSGCEVLEPKKYIAGDQIPLVPYFGKRRVVDGVERVRGHVRKAKDPQRVYNSQIAKLTEQAALAPQERPIFTPEQVAGHEQSWAEANINRSPYQLINPILGPDGAPLPAGPIGKIEPPTLNPVMAALIQITANDIAELTNSDDAASETKSNVSADAMDIAATRIDDKAAGYIDNMKQSVQRAGEIWLAMAREVYWEEGREVETIDTEGQTPGTATLAEPYTDPDTKSYSIRNDIATGRYRVISDVAEATTTRRDKTVRTLNAIGQAVAAYDPELAQACTLTALLNMDGEGMDDLQAWGRKKGLASGLVKPSEQEQREMDEAAQNQQPDPQAALLLAMAKEKEALAGKAGQDTELSAAKVEETKAKTVETLAKAHATHEGAQEQKRQGVFGRLSSIFQPKPKAGA